MVRSRGVILEFEIEEKVLLNSSLFLRKHGDFIERLRIDTCAIFSYTLSGSSHYTKSNYNEVLTNLFFVKVFNSIKMY